MEWFCQNLQICLRIPLTISNFYCFHLSEDRYLEGVLEVLLVVLILSGLIARHHRLVKGLLQAGIGIAEERIQNNIINLGRNIASVLVKEKVREVIPESLHFISLVHHFAERRRRRLVQESIRGKQRRGIGRITERHSQRRPSGDVLRGVHIAVPAVIKIYFDLRLRSVVELQL